MISDIKNINRLTEKERLYFSLMYPKSGVLYITSEPGIAKSSIIRKIAEKLGFLYLDERLSYKDETDMGLYPTLVQYDGKQFLDHVVPLWAHKANLQPTIIHFEELNRSQLPVRNAALQILLERAIGDDFKFNDNVYMVATGNLGDDDNTDVEEFDSSLNNRLIHIRHKLTLNEWLEDFANDNVHSVIRSFLIAHPEHFYVKSDKRDIKAKAYSTARTWTFLSDFIIANFGKNCELSDFISSIEYVAHCFIGSSSHSFLRYCRDTMKLSINDILNNYSNISNLLKDLNRDTKSEILSNLKQIKLASMTNEQRDNSKNFLLNCLTDDEIVGYLVYVIDKEINTITEGKTIIDMKEDEKIVVSYLKDKKLIKYRNKIYRYLPK